MARSGKKTEVTSFRLESNALTEMRKIAENEKVSLNTLVSQIFDQYTNWSHSATKAGFVPLPKTVLIKILDNLDDDEIIDVANYVANEQIKSLLLVVRKAYTTEDFVKGLEYWTKASNFHFSHVEKLNNTHQYIMQHDMGKKWSFYYKHVFEKIFVQLGAKKPDIDTTDSTVVITLFCP